MCDERRGMVTGANMDGKEPTQTMSFNSPKLLLYKGVIIFAITVIAATWGAGVIIANVMTSIAAVNFERRLDKELEVNGRIHVEMHRIVQEDKRDNDDRLLRMETMLDPIYKKVTGHDPPPRIPR